MMFTSKRNMLEAVQWTGDNALELNAFIGLIQNGSREDGYSGFRYSPRDGLAATYDTTHNAWLALGIGDWVAKDGLRYYPIEAELFRRHYEPAVTPGSGAPTLPGVAGAITTSTAQPTLIADFIMVTDFLEALDNLPPEPTREDMADLFQPFGWGVLHRDLHDLLAKIAQLRAESVVPTPMQLTVEDLYSAPSNWSVRDSVGVDWHKVNGSHLWRNEDGQHEAGANLFSRHGPIMARG